MNKQNFIENSLIILTKQTLDKFLEQDNPADLMALYTFYYYTAKWQGTNKPKCSTAYVANGLHWSENKVRKMKKQLIEFGLIGDVRTMDESNKIVGHYIKANYIFKKETAEKQENSESHPHDNPQGGNNHSMETRGTNALSTNKLNALNNNKENIIGENFEKLWKMLPSNKNDRKSKVTKKRKKELYEMGESAIKAITLYLNTQNSSYYHARHNILNELIDNYIDNEMPTNKNNNGGNHMFGVEEGYTNGYQRDGNTESGGDAKRRWQAI